MKSFQKICLIISLLIVGLSFYWVFSKLESLPERIPTHFNFSGLPDQYGSRSSIWILPVVSFVMFLLMTLVSSLSVSFNYPVQITPENAEKQKENVRVLLGLVQVEVSVLFFLILYDMVRVAQGTLPGLSSSYKIMIAVLIVTIAAMIYRSVKLR